MKSKLTEEMDWIRKYLIEVSELRKFFFLKINGKKENVLSSRPIQQLIHELEEIVIIILNIIKVKNINLELLIKKKEVIFISEVWVH